MRVPPPLHYLGYAILVASLASFVPGFAGLFLDTNLKPALVLVDYGLLLAAIGMAWLRLLEPSRPMTLGDAVLTAVLSWIIVPLIAAVPIWLGLGVPFIDAWYESVSGFTTTGLTMFCGKEDSYFGVYVPSVEDLPRAVQLWRSFIQWIGGVGIIVIFAAFIIGGGMPSHLLGLAEGRYFHLEPSVARSIRGFILVYVVLTMLAFLLFVFAGMDPYDALNHAMTGIATGGFSTHSNSFASYDSVKIELAGVVVMTLGAMNFADHYNVLSYVLFLRGKPSRVLRNPEHKVYLILVISWVSVLTALLSALGYAVERSWRYALFQYVSALSGTGFQTMDLGRAPDAFKFILVPACLTGGAILSTTGGIKLFRFIVVLSSFKWVSQKLVLGRGYVPLKKVGGELVNEDVVLQALSIVAAFVAAWFIGTVATLVFYPGVSLADAAFETASALGNVGLSTGITGPDMPIAIKLVHIILMSLGRLEIVPYIVAAHSALRSLKLKIKTLMRQRRQAH